MRIVADTNTFLAVALDEPERQSILLATRGAELVAPDVLPFEIGNALTAMMKKRNIEPEELILAWNAVQLIPVELRSVDVRHALCIAAERNIYAYDAYFLECSLSLRLPLLTLDRRLRNTATALGINVLEVK